MADGVDTRGRRLFDTTINVQTLCAALVGAAIAICVGWFSLVGRVEKLEGKELTQDDRMTRIERDQQQQRSDVKEQVSAVAGDVKEILRYLRDNASVPKPELKRWIK
jgi:predicted membrane protein